MTSTLNDHESFVDPDEWSSFDTSVDTLLDRAAGWRFGSSGERGPVRMVGEDGRAIAVQRLLDELRTDFGFVVSARDQKRLRQWSRSDVGAFTDAVFVAMGLDPSLFSNLRGQVRARVERSLPTITAAPPPPPPQPP